MYSGDGMFYTYGGNCSLGQLLPRGLDMSERYKETSTGGLAVNVVEC